MVMLPPPALEVRLRLPPWLVGDGTLTCLLSIWLTLGQRAPYEACVWSWAVGRLGYQEGVEDQEWMREAFPNSQKTGDQAADQCYIPTSWLHAHCFHDISDFASVLELLGMGKGGGGSGISDVGAGREQFQFPRG